MRLSGMPVDLDEDIAPVVNSQYAVRLKGNNLNKYCAAGDTILAASFGTIPAFPAVITQIATSQNDANDEAKHPFITAHPLPPSASLMKVRIAIVNDDSMLSTRADWNHISSSLQQTVGTMHEAAISNAQVWISTAQCTDFVFLLHNDQCLNQEQGSVVGRSNTYHVGHHIFLYRPDGHEDQNSFDLVDIERADYHPFGPANGPMLNTEKKCHALHQLSRCNTYALTKCSKIGGYYSMKFPMDRSNWEYIKNNIKHLGGNNIIATDHTKDTKAAIVHSNLSHETRLVTCPKQKIKTLNFEGVAAIKAFVTQNMGIGITKRKLTKEQIREDGRYQELHEGDTVLMVDIDLNGYADQGTEGDLDEWFDGRAIISASKQFTRENYNFMQFEYDFRLGEFTFAFRAAALKSGVCNADRFVMHLQNAQNNWNIQEHNEPGAPRLGMYLEDDAMVLWTVHRLIHASRQAVIMH